MTELSQTVTQEIRAQMARRRMSQRELATRLGWSQAYLSRRLTGDVPLSFGDVEQMAAELDISVLQLAWPAQAHGAKGNGT